MKILARGLAFLLLSIILAAGCQKAPAPPPPPPRPTDGDPPKGVGPIDPAKEFKAK